MRASLRTRAMVWPTAVVCALASILGLVAAPHAARAQVQEVVPGGELPPIDPTAPGNPQPDGSFEPQGQGQGQGQGQAQTVPGEAAPKASDPTHGRIANRVAVFSGIDKITGRITTFDVYIDETVQFGALQVTPRVCYSRDETEAPRTDGFVEVDEITLDRKIRRIFTGWMFADSPGLNAVEHPVYDIWLKGSKMDSDVPPPEETKPS